MKVSNQISYIISCSKKKRKTNKQTNKHNKTKPQKTQNRTKPITSYAFTQFIFILCRLLRCHDKLRKYDVIEKINFEIVSSYYTNE